MKRSTVNFAIDAAGYVGLVLLVTTGVLVRYVLPPGSGTHTTLWGLDRHEWGALHFWVAVGFCCALVLHLFLHWRWILCVMRGRPREPSGGRLVLGLLGALAVVALALAPFAGTVEQEGRASAGGGRSGGRIAGGESASGASGRIADDELVDGRMTLAEVESATGVPAVHLIARLGLPADVPRDEGLGKLRRQYGFDMETVRKVVEEYGAGR